MAFSWHVSSQCFDKHETHRDSDIEIPSFLDLSTELIRIFSTLDILAE
jgi:hypothetical protein